MKKQTIWRKGIAIITVAVLSLTLMTACGSTGASTEADNAASVSEVAWNYVSPSDLKGSTAADTAGTGGNAAQAGSDENADDEAADGAAGQGNGETGDAQKAETNESGNSDDGSDVNGAPAGQPPEKPDGDGDGSGTGSEGSGVNGAPAGQPPEKPEGDGNGPGSGSGGPGGGSPGGANTASYDYTGTLTGALTADGETVSSDGESVETAEKDQNALLAENGGTLEVSNASIAKSGSDEDGDNCNFYGLNASVLSSGEGSKVYLSDSTISSDSAGSNGIFATDSAEVYVNATEIDTTEGDNARGLDATYGGVIYGNDLTISTEKDHCAALATDRGGGYISVTNSSLETAGSGSPLLYSTGDIEVDNVTGTASGSQIAGMEGMNRIIINNSDLASTNDGISGSDPIKNGVILYQSTSGDADTASTDVAEFEAVDSTLHTAISDGAMFYVTNTNAKVVLQNTDLDFDTENVALLYASGNDANNWGTAGSNGGTVTLTGIAQTLAGDIYTDDISSADVYLTEDSTWTGTATGENNVSIHVDSTSQWVVTADTTVTDLALAEGGQIVDAEGNAVTIVVDGETVVAGDSAYTVTVTGSYGTEVTLTEAQSLDTDVLRRDAFDSHYDLATKFGTNAQD